MKRSELLFVVFMLTAAVAFSGCGSIGGGGGYNNNPGTIMVALTDAADFNGKDVMCAIFDSDEIDEEEEPTGEFLGFGIIDVSDGSGSCVILDDYGNQKTFDPDVYYLIAWADLDGSGDEDPTPGDIIMWFKEATVNGDVTIGITGDDFTETVPGGDNNNLGTIMVALTDATDFNGKDVMCAIFDSDEIDEEEEPTGEFLGFGIIDVSDGSGSCVILDDYGNQKTFNPDVYYLIAWADLDGSGDEDPTPGDIIMWFKEVTVNGDVTIGITGDDFTETVPGGDQ